MPFITRYLLEASDGGGHYTMPIIAIFVILLLGLSGSLIPPLVGVYLPKFDLNSRYGFRFFNGLAAGIVLGVASICLLRELVDIHSIPDAQESFESALAGKEGKAAEYAWGGLLAMLGSLLTFVCEEFVHRRVGRFAVLHGHSHDHNHSHPHDTTGHCTTHHSKRTSSDASKPLEEGMAKSEEEATKDTKEGDASIPRGELDMEIQIGYFTELYVLLFGLSFHSIFVGIALGISGDDWGLFAAVVFHQFFEGLALGARVARAGFKKKLHIWILDIVYALAIPVGIAIGIGIQSAVVDDPFNYGIVDGTFQGLSGGVLIYVSLIHMMKEEISRPEFKTGGPLLYIMYAGFLIGAAVMAVIGIWA